MGHKKALRHSRHDDGTEHLPQCVPCIGPPAAKQTLSGSFRTYGGIPVVVYAAVIQSDKQVESTCPSGLFRDTCGKPATGSLCGTKAPTANVHHYLMVV